MDWPDAFDSGTYGRSFADVYDDWYGSEDPRSLVSLIGSRCRSGRILELGAGTGRVAIPLAEAGHRVIAMDASPEMLEVLDRRLSADPPRGPGSVRAVLGDVGSAQDYPEGPFDAVVAGFNLICNLADGEAQLACLRASAGVLAPDGFLVVESFVPAPPGPARITLSAGRTDAAGPVLIATEPEPGGPGIRGAHLETVDGAVVRVRPWRICPISPADLDGLAATAGLRLEGRWADAAGTPYVEGVHTGVCSVYVLGGNKRPDGRVGGTHGPNQSGDGDPRDAVRGVG